MGALCLRACSPALLPSPQPAASPAPLGSAPWNWRGGAVEHNNERFAEKSEAMVQRLPIRSFPNPVLCLLEQPTWSEGGLVACKFPTSK